MKYRKSIGEWPPPLSFIMAQIRNRAIEAPARFWRMRYGWSIWT